MKTLLPLTAVLLLTACNPSPQPVNLGTDECAHCKMTIVEKPFAAELVNTKGKAFKFDAIECMVNYLAEKEEADFAYTLVRDFTAPDDWIDAQSAYYLISNQLPSPMGAYLSAYKDKTGAETMQQQKGGEIYDWMSLKDFLHQ